MSNETLLPGAEPFLFKGSDVGVLLSHGFTGSTQSMRYIGEQLHARGGFTVLGPRLPGHGTTPEDMARHTARDWVQCIDESLALLRGQCRKVFMGGLSLGGTLTLLSGARHADLAGIVPINACVQISSPPLAGLVFDAQAPEFLPGIGSDIQAAGVTELAYERTPVAALSSAYLAFTIARELLPTVQCPALVLQSDVDHVVPPANGDLIVNGLGCADKQLVRLHDSFHVATLDNDKDRIVELMLGFIERLA
jgi:carboxylesterase